MKRVLLIGAGGEIVCILGLGVFAGWWTALGMFVFCLFLAIPIGLGHLDSDSDIG